MNRPAASINPPRLASGATAYVAPTYPATPDTQSGKAVKARRYGTRILAEPAFWRTVGVHVD